MNSVLKEILSTGYTSTASGEKTTITPHSISEIEGTFLRELVLKYKLKSSLEIGLAYGVSTLFICDALCQGHRNARHTVIDPNQTTEWKGIGIHNLQKAGFRNMVELLEMPSHKAMPKLLEQKRRFDFALIDGCHTFDYAPVDFFYIDKLLEVGGIVVFDDADFPSIRKVCRYICKNFPYSVIILDKEEKYLKLSGKRKLMKKILRVPKAERTAKYFLKPEFFESDPELRLVGSMIAFQKKSDEQINSEVHHEF